MKVGRFTNIFFDLNRLPIDVGLRDDNIKRRIKSKTASVAVGYSRDDKVIPCREEALSLTRERFKNESDLYFMQIIHFRIFFHKFTGAYRP